MSCPLHLPPLYLGIIFPLKQIYYQHKAMNPISHFIDYVKNIREPKNISMTSAREIDRGINVKSEPKAKRNSHLWCYRNAAIDSVERWLADLDIIKNPNFKSFDSFEKLYDYVEKNIIGIKGVGAVMVYDVALCLGERMEPQVVPQEYVYVHGKLIDVARHLFGLMKVPLRTVKHGHRISISHFEPLGIETLDKRYAARAVEEWLCNEAENIARAKTIGELM